MQPCEYCGAEFNAEAEGHTHENCECRICCNSEIVKNLSFCSPECECNFINENQ